MANLSMNLGDKLIFDGNEASPNTYMTNPASATAPNNTIEVWCNGTKRAEFQNAKMLLGNELEFTAETPTVRCHGGLKVHLDVDAVHPAFQSFVVNSGTTASYEPVVEISANRVQSYWGLRFSAGAGAVAGRRLIDTEGGDIEVAAQTDVRLRANYKADSPSSKVRILDYQTEVATFESGGIAFNAAITLAPAAVLLGNVVASGAGIFGGKVDGSAAGVRTKTVSGSNPSGGDPGDIQIRSDVSKLFVNVGGTWKSVTLA